MTCAADSQECRILETSCMFFCTTIGFGSSSDNEAATTNCFMYLVSCNYCHVVETVNRVSVSAWAIIKGLSSNPSLDREFELFFRCNSSRKILSLASVDAEM